MPRGITPSERNLSVPTNTEKCGEKGRFKGKLGMKIVGGGM